MEQRLNVSLKKSIKPSKLLIILTLLSIFLLSVALTLIPHKNINYAHKILKLPRLIDTQKNVNKKKETSEWTIVKTQSGDTLAALFHQVGLSRQTLQTVLYHNPHANTLIRLKPNQELQFLIQNQQLEKLLVPVNTTQFLVVSRQNGHYVSRIKSRKTNTHRDYITATVRGSLYGTAQRQHIPYRLIQQMTELFNWEIDFVRDIRAGDQFSMVYQAYYIEDKLISTGDILAVTYTNRGKIHQAIRYTNADGDHDYYTPQGVSLKKAFSRYPIKFSHISSTFSLSRNHPILHYRRPHNGIDLAASIGTPVRATGDGRIELIDRHQGYGNMIKVSHNKTYASVYAHLLKFQKGLFKGAHVKRGQVIGYVGQSGLATGPHCHYEFHIHHQPRNPATIELPRASPVPQREMAAFKTKASTLLARLKLYEDANLIAATRKTKNTV